MLKAEWEQHWSSRRAIFLLLIKKQQKARAQSNLERHLVVTFESWKEAGVFPCSLSSSFPYFSPKMMCFYWKHLPSNQNRWAGADALARLLPGLEHLELRNCPIKDITAWVGQSQNGNLFWWEITGFCWVMHFTSKDEGIFLLKEKLQVSSLKAGPVWGWSPSGVLSGILPWGLWSGENTPEWCSSSTLHWDA